MSALRQHLAKRSGNITGRRIDPLGDGILGLAERILATTTPEAAAILAGDIVQAASPAPRSPADARVLMGDGTIVDTRPTMRELEASPCTPYWAVHVLRQRHTIDPVDLWATLHTLERAARRHLDGLQGRTVGHDPDPGVVR